MFVIYKVWEHMWTEFVCLKERKRQLNFAYAVEMYRIYKIHGFILLCLPSRTSIRRTVYISLSM
jgi:hypothetical protein